MKKILTIDLILNEVKEYDKDKVVDNFDDILKYTPDIMFINNKSEIYTANDVYNIAKNSNITIKEAINKLFNI